MKSEQRKEQRLAVTDNVYVSLGGGLTRVGSLKDIHAEGISFEYVSYGVNSASCNDETATILDENSLYLSGLRCRIVYDVPAHDGPVWKSLPKSLIKRRCGLQFLALEKKQKKQLDLLLQEYHS